MGTAKAKQVRYIFLGKDYHVIKEMKEEDTVIFGKLSNDFNPLHFNEELSKKTRFKGCIVHGMRAAILFSGVLAELTPWCVYLKQKIEFVAPIRIGDKITATGEIVGINYENGEVEVFLNCKNQKGEIVVRGEALLKKLKEMHK